MFFEKIKTFKCRNMSVNYQTLRTIKIFLKYENYLRYFLNISLSPSIFMEERGFKGNCSALKNIYIYKGRVQSKKQILSMGTSIALSKHAQNHASGIFPHYRGWMGYSFFTQHNGYLFTLVHWSLYNKNGRRSGEEGEKRVCRDVFSFKSNEIFIIIYYHFYRDCFVSGPLPDTQSLQTNTILVYKNKTTN